MRVRLAFGTLLLAGLPLCAQEGADLYKTKCVGCHGATGEGKAALAGTNLLSAEAKKHTDADMKSMISEGGKKAKAAHAFEKKGITVKQVDSLVAYVRTLQKK